MRQGRILFGSPEGMVKDLLEYVTDLEEERDRALAQIREWNKDAEIQKAQEHEKEAYQILSRGFAPDEKQWEKIHAWEKEHTRQYHKMPKLEYPTKRIPNAPDYEYRFSPTHIGTLGEVICTVCYKKAITESKGDTSLLNEIVNQRGISYSFGEV